MQTGAELIPVLQSALKTSERLPPASVICIHIPDCKPMVGQKPLWSVRLLTGASEQDRVASRQDMDQTGHRILTAPSRAYYTDCKQITHLNSCGVGFKCGERGAA